MISHMIEPLTPATYPAWLELAQKHNGVADAPSNRRRDAVVALDEFGGGRPSWRRQVVGSRMAVLGLLGDCRQETGEIHWSSDHGPVTGDDVHER